MFLSKALLMGRLGKKPVLKTTSDGKNYAYFSIASNKKLKNGKDFTQWHFITAWEKLADLAHTYLDKGSAVFIEGELRYREMEDRDGKKFQSCSIVAQNIQLLDKKNETQEDGNNESHGNVKQEDSTPTNKSFENNSTNSSPFDDIPF